MEVSTSDCLSCLENKNVFNIFDTHECEGKEEIYVDMLKSCLDITISEESGINGMCEKCILKLRDAYYLKKNIIKNMNVLKNEVSIQIEYLEDTQSSNDKLYHEEDLGPQLDPETGDLFYVLVKEDKPIKMISQIQTSNKQNYYMNSGTQKRNSIGNIVNTFDVRNERLIKNEKSCENGNADINIGNNSSSECICEQCGKTFPTPKRLNTHMVSHMDGPHICHYCGMVFSKINTKNAHVWRTHRTKEPYICGQCGERFTTFHKRLKHLQQIHGQTAEYPCPHCDKKFFYSAPRSKHIRSIHLNIRNHKCTECKMAFSKRRALLGHMACKHGIGEKPHKCPTCGKCFCRTTTLKIHMKRHEQRISQKHHKYEEKKSENCLYINDNNVK